MSKSSRIAAGLSKFDCPCRGLRLNRHCMNQRSLVHTLLVFSVLALNSQIELRAGVSAPAPLANLLPEKLAAFLTAGGGLRDAVSSLAEGIRVDTFRTPIRVSAILPGYIRSEMNESLRTPLIVDTDKGVRSIIHAIEREVSTARVPRWPWAPLGAVLRILPVRVLARMG